MDIKGYLENYPEVSFIGDMSVEDIKSHYMECMGKKYEELTGKKLVLAEAAPVRLVAYTNCMILYQIAQYADRAGKMSLLKYSYGDYLENIGALKGVQRLQAGKAVTTLRFTLSAKRPCVTVIPEGTRVTAADGVYFSTVERLEIPEGEMQGEVNAECREAGKKGNGYTKGELCVLVDPVAYIGSVGNTTISQGGSDREGDERLAERIYITPSSWSVAGPDDAYVYWVKTFDPAIQDVRVRSVEPGVVEIRFLMDGGERPTETVVQKLEKFLMDGSIRPLTDNVHVAAPETHAYRIRASYYINRSDMQKAGAIQESVGKAVKEYVAWQSSSIGRDIVPDKLTNLIIGAGAKRIEIASPVFEKLHWDEVAVLEGKPEVIYGGMEDD